MSFSSAVHRPCHGVVLSSRLAPPADLSLLTYCTARTCAVVHRCVPPSCRIVPGAFLFGASVFRGGQGHHTKPISSRVRLQQQVTSCTLARKLPADGASGWPLTVVWPAASLGIFGNGAPRGVHKYTSPLCSLPEVARPGMCVWIAAATLTAATLAVAAAAGVVGPLTECHTTVSGHRRVYCLMQQACDHSRVASLLKSSREKS